MSQNNKFKCRYQYGTGYDGLLRNATKYFCLSYWARMLPGDFIAPSHLSFYTNSWKLQQKCETSVSCCLVAVFLCILFHFWLDFSSRIYFGFMRLLRISKCKHTIHSTTYYVLRFTTFFHIMCLNGATYFQPQRVIQECCIGLTVFIEHFFYKNIIGGGRHLPANEPAEPTPRFPKVDAFCRQKIDLFVCVVPYPSEPCGVKAVCAITVSHFLCQVTCCSRPNHPATLVFCATRLLSKKAERI